MEDIPGKKPRKRSLRQMEYCYEAELEGAQVLLELAHAKVVALSLVAFTTVVATAHSDHTTGAYKAGLLKAFERTVKEARYAMVMVDAPNVAADDLRAYWSAGQVPPY